MKLPFLMRGETRHKATKHIRFKTEERAREALAALEAKGGHGIITDQDDAVVLPDAIEMIAVWVLVISAQAGMPPDDVSYLQRDKKTCQYAAKYASALLVLRRSRCEQRNVTKEELQQLRYIKEHPHGKYLQPF